MNIHDCFTKDELEYLRLWEKKAPKGVFNLLTKIAILRCGEYPTKDDLIQMIETEMIFHKKFLIKEKSNNIEKVLKRSKLYAMESLNGMYTAKNRDWTIKKKWLKILSENFKTFTEENKEEIREYLEENKTKIIKTKEKVLNDKGEYITITHQHEINKNGRLKGGNIKAIMEVVNDQINLTRNTEIYLIRGKEKLKQKEI